MPKANTYRAERLLGPHGFSLTDVYVVNGNNRGPVVFRKVGEFIDLKKVGIKAMVKSALNGQINKLLVSGVLSTMPQDVSQEKFNEIQESLAGFGLGNYNDSPIKSPVKYVNLEPGVTVAISHVTERPEEAKAIQPEAEPMTAQLEPGLVAPTGAAGRQNVEALGAPVPETTKTKSSKKSSKKQAEASEVPAEPAEAVSPYADWKFNLDFQTQKRTILESTDKEFLKWVTENDDSVQFKKLAQTKLADGSF